MARCGARRPREEGEAQTSATASSKPEAPTPGFQRDNTSAAAFTPTWRVVADPAGASRVPGHPQADDPVPAYFGSDYIVYPTTPSPFVMLGDNANDEHYREVWDLRSATRVVRLQGKIDVFKPRGTQPRRRLFRHPHAVRTRRTSTFGTSPAHPIARIADDGKHIYDIADFAGPGKGKVIFGSHLSKMFEIWDFRGKGRRGVARCHGRRRATVRGLTGGPAPPGILGELLHKEELTAPARSRR